MTFFITIVITNTAIILLAFFFWRWFCKNGRSKQNHTFGTTVEYTPNTVQENMESARKDIKDNQYVTAENEEHMEEIEPTTQEEIQPATQEEIKGMDFFSDVYKLPDGSKKTSYLMAFAEAGDSAAQCSLGEAYLFENGGLKRDFEKAKIFLQQSANQGNSNAMADLVLTYMELLGDFIDDAHRKGESEAEYMSKGMALIDEAAYNLAKALTNYNKLALNLYNGSMKLWWNEGTMREILLEKTDKTLPELLDELKAEDNGYSNYILGMLTLRGIGTPKDINQAKLYFERGAEFDHFESKKELENLSFIMDDE